MSQTQQPGDDRPSPSLTRHRRESFWQIIFPVLLVLLILLGAFVLVVLSGTAGISGVADLSLILASIPLLVAGLLVLAVFVGLLLGVGWLLSRTQVATRFAQDISARVSDVVQKVMGFITNAIIPAITGFSMARRLLGGNGEDGSESQINNPPAS
jgi:hypothetical protein